MFSFRANLKPYQFQIGRKNKIKKALKYSKTVKNFFILQKKQTLKTQIIWQPSNFQKQPSNYSFRCFIFNENAKVLAF